MILKKTYFALTCVIPIKFIKTIRNIGIHTEKSTDIMPDFAIVIDKSFRK
jgi:hypothetical protein